MGLTVAVLAIPALIGIMGCLTLPVPIGEPEHHD